jgi:hypothetical protein
MFEGPVGVHLVGSVPLGGAEEVFRRVAYLGDALIHGRVVLWSKRPRGIRTYDLTRYRATLRIYDEYCHLVNKRPLSECDKPFKKRMGWTYQT